MVAESSRSSNLTSSYEIVEQARRDSFMPRSTRWTELRQSENEEEIPDTGSEPTTTEENI